MDAVKVVEVGNVPDDPKLITIQKHDFACALIGLMEIRLAIELVCISNAWSQIRR